MADFYFYDFTFKDVPKDQSLFPEYDGDTTNGGNALARFIMGKKKLHITDANKDGDVESYINNLRTIENVSVQDMSNKEEVKVVDSHYSEVLCQAKPLLLVEGKLLVA